MPLKDSFQTVFGWLIAIGGIAFFGFLVIHFWSEYKHDSTLSKKGIKTQAVLDNTYTEYRKNGIVDGYRITYKFSINNRTYSGESVVRTLPTTGEITIQYDPIDPTTNSVPESEGFFSHMAEIGVAAVLVAVIAGVRLFIRWVGKS